jgi:hypothetical protein
MTPEISRDAGMPLKLAARKLVTLSPGIADRIAPFSCAAVLMLRRPPRMPAITGPSTWLAEPLSTA